MYYVYILKSLKDKKLYIGFTSDLNKRFKEHIEGKVESTKNRRPLVLVYYEAYKTKEDAIERERQLKYFGKAYSQLKRKIRKSIINA
ncbi:GIY-YIG nuclease family protein [Patescibacteria group bacterium]|nr:GIY-YIG nuclease family protein [Candidatus Falkowbacteria bacterium]MBU3905819.1 GIY-YIG nuclease family protein [Patescibacteria group bacterium]MCG2698559.1 GIY-YIG nuclease family protein [Candidatus Parcubacteria bacterium]MBU4014890.1 GIY-YIG nuclease family protein [Patescibacteria group bacterium]MBU4026548.1 GIY-YIG nuclease family protein [Patescibacteria group bacterium]